MMNGSHENVLQSNVINTTGWNVSYDNAELVHEVEDDVPLPIVIILILVGTFGNCLVCLAIYLDRKLKNLTNYFLLSLAVTDLLVCLLILPGRLLAVRYDLQPSTFPLCFLFLIGDDFVTAASAIHICFISCGRYFAIKNPFNQRSLTRKMVTVKIGLVWVLSFITVIPYMASVILTHHPNEPTYCYTLLSTFIYFQAIVFIEALTIIVMVVIVVVSFILTTLLLNEIARKQQENTASRGSKLVRTVGGQITNDKSKKEVPQSEKKALRVIWILSFAFIICMVPYTCIGLFFFFFPHIVIPPVLIDIVGYLYYLNSVINPIIYTIFNKRFREDFKNLILFRFKKDK